MKIHKPLLTFSTKRPFGSLNTRNTKIFLTKILGLDICGDTLVGDEMLKGISGGQKKRLTTG